MNIGFFIGEMNFRGVANSTYLYSHYNEKILKNKSYIFYDSTNHRNQSEVINKFKKRFKVIGIKKISEVDKFEKKFKLNYLYIQKSGNKDKWRSNKIKTIVHSVFPQKLSQTHGHKYAYISEWLSYNFSGNKIPYVPYIVEISKIKNNLKKKLNITKKQIVIGCHGGSSSFDLKFVKDALLEIVKLRKDIIFLFLNIEKFANHNRIIFLKGTTNINKKKLFLNTCDVMIYARSQGESFGLACAEFAVMNKKIISYKFNRHRAHLDHLNYQNIIEYTSKQSLMNILKNIKKEKNIKIKDNKYLKYNSNFVMKIFKKVFLNNKTDLNLSFSDYIKNYIAHIKMLYYYIRHKIYNHYYRLTFFGK